MEAIHLIYTKNPYSEDPPFSAQSEVLGKPHPMAQETARPNKIIAGSQSESAPHGEPMKHFAVDPLTEAHDLGIILYRQEPILGHHPLSIVDQPQKTSCAGCV